MCYLRYNYPFEQAKQTFRSSTLFDVYYKVGLTPQIKNQVILRYGGRHIPTALKLQSRLKLSGYNFI